MSSKHTRASEPIGSGLIAEAGPRIAIESVEPEIDGGRFPAKGVQGDRQFVEADIFGDGHEKLAACLLYKRDGEVAWREAPMAHVDNDRWRGSFELRDNAYYRFSILAWRDLFATWTSEVLKKVAASIAVELEVREGVALVAKAKEEGARGTPQDRQDLDALLDRLTSARSTDDRLELLLADDTLALMTRSAPRVDQSPYGKELSVWVDRPAARFSAWYEMFPRSQTTDPQRHGTFDDVIERLPYVRDMGFDVLYFPPIHPIGTVNRKGRNNAVKAQPGEVGSPYAIGSVEGGHKAIHRQLGTVEDFRRLVAAAADHGLEIALDFAIQCAPDHPWITEHPEWFDWRPDGTIKFAENPPKKYEDIVNVHFYGASFPALWEELRDVVRYWVEQGVRMFRVDNPHTKPFPFWEWLIGDIRRDHPDVIFLAEAFTRPKVMARLAKIGFSQSYSYFTWRNSKAELTEYLKQLTATDLKYYFQPNFFVNTPDINPYFLQTSGRAGFRARLVLAATLSTSYGVYNGFELCEAAPISGKEEYLDSEKYEIRVRDWNDEQNIRSDVVLINRLRREYAALQQFARLEFFNFWNDSIIYYGKRAGADVSDEMLLFAVNHDPHNVQSGHFEVPLWKFGLPDDASIDVEDLVSGQRFTWTGKIQHAALDPAERPYAIWKLLHRSGEAK